MCDDICKEHEWRWGMWSPRLEAKLDKAGKGGCERALKQLGEKMNVINYFKFRDGAEYADAVNEMGRKMDLDELITKGICGEMERNRIKDCIKMVCNHREADNYDASATTKRVLSHELFPDPLASNLTLLSRLSKTIKIPTFEELKRRNDAIFFPRKHTEAQHTRLERICNASRSSAYHPIPRAGAIKLANMGYSVEEVAVMTRKQIYGALGAHLCSGKKCECKRIKDGSKPNLDPGNMKNIGLNYESTWSIDKSVDDLFDV